MITSMSYSSTHSYSYSHSQENIHKRFTADVYYPKYHNILSPPLQGILTVLTVSTLCTPLPPAAKKDNQTNCLPSVYDLRIFSRFRDRILLTNLVFMGKLC